jgi:predicted transcriptional regulator of viral defense system
MFVQTMASRPATTPSPNWDQLYEIAQEQDGYFTTAQALQAGYSPPLLHHYLRRGRIARERRGIYRLVHFPPGEHEQLVVLWLWSDQEGVFSHETALLLHDLSDALPSRVHMTLPPAWRGRRVHFPRLLIPHYGGVPPQDRRWFGSVPVTTPARTVRDCARDGVLPNLVRQAAEEGLSRGLFSQEEIPEATGFLEPGGGR